MTLERSRGWIAPAVLFNCMLAATGAQADNGTPPSNPNILHAVQGVQSSVNTLQGSVNALQGSINAIPTTVPLAPTKASQLVTLRDGGNACSLPPAMRLDSRVMADGSTQPFTIPADSVFVITGIGVRASSLPQPTNIAVIRYGLLSRTSTALNVLLEDQLFTGALASDPAKTTAVSNVVIKAGTELCVFVICGNACPSFELSPAAAYLYGYLAKDQ